MQAQAAAACNVAARKVPRSAAPRLLSRYACERPKAAHVCIAFA